MLSQFQKGGYKGVAGLVLSQGFAGACRELLGLLLHLQLNRTLIWGSDSRQRRDDVAWDGRGVGFKRHCQTH